MVKHVSQKCVYYKAIMQHVESFFKYFQTSLHVPRVIVSFRVKGVRWDGVKWGAVATRRESYDGYGTKEATVEPTGVEGRGWLEGVLEVWIHGLRSTASDVTRLVRKPTTTVTTTTTITTTTTPPSFQQ
ncbi:AF4/FMR2 family member lilli-like isoform X2 [Vespula maculifrons]|uniref:AF4/FMR2 family member lilli-like isoform X2 n=1 Tax=Vespula maculifrons TaxID=7453 RepID=A0ABD2B5D9_VESMC